MIPISADERFTYDEGGVRYFLQAITGSNEVEYLNLCAACSGNNIKEMSPHIDKVFDFFVKGWEPLDGKKIPSYPQDGKPSVMFRIKDKDRLCQIAIDMNSLSDKDQKN